ncbi:MAG: metallophosphoesterase, partial [Thermotogaceae bacterium]|nr:metallophosphoesterase [Thermotogaceae bacterium]
MVRFFGVTLILLATAVFSIYPFLDHPPIWLFENGLPTVDFESTELSLLKIKIKTADDEFTLIDEAALRHRVHVPLKENFEYEIYQDDLLIGKGKIVYPSSKLSNFTVLVYGDTRSDEKRVQEKIIEREKCADFLVHLGDIAYFDFIDEEYRRFFNTLHKFGKISFIVKGNHELPGLRYSMYFYPDYYSFKIGSYRFFVLDGNDPLNLLKLRAKRLFEEYKNGKTNRI